MHSLNAGQVQHEHHAIEDTLREIASTRMFANLSSTNSIPDHTTIINLRRTLERHGLTRQIFEEISTWLSNAGILVKEDGLKCHYYSRTEPTDNKAGNIYFTMKFFLLLTMAIKKLKYKRNQVAPVDWHITQSPSETKALRGFLALIGLRGLVKNDIKLAILFVLTDIFRIVDIRLHTGNLHLDKQNDQ